jgi:hypothetical protein
MEGTVVGLSGENAKSCRGITSWRVLAWLIGFALTYPVRFAAIYFLPSVAIDMGPTNDGMHILRRFTARQGLARRLVRPPPALARFFRASFHEIIHEFDAKQFGYEVRLRTLLMEMLVRLMRWEQEIGCEVGKAMLTTSWTHVEKALSSCASISLKRFMRETWPE